MADLTLGQIVISKQGKDMARVYVVVGMKDDKVLLADAKKFNVSRPKRKNPKHIQPTRIVLDELKERIVAGMDIDNGRFRYLLQKSEFIGR